MRRSRAVGPFPTRASREEIKLKEVVDQRSNNGSSRALLRRSHHACRQCHMLHAYAKGVGRVVRVPRSDAIMGEIYKCTDMIGTVSLYHWILFEKISWNTVALHQNISWNTVSLLPVPGNTGAHQYLGVHWVLLQLATRSDHPRKKKKKLGVISNGAAARCQIKIRAAPFRHEASPSIYTNHTKIAMHISFVVIGFMS
jgi:hypothetical protein